MSHHVKFGPKAEMRNNLGELHKLTLAKSKKQDHIYDSTRTISTEFIARVYTISRTGQPGWLCECRCTVLCCAKLGISIRVSQNLSPHPWPSPARLFHQSKPGKFGKDRSVRYDVYRTNLPCRRLHAHGRSVSQHDNTASAAIL